jgi:ethanolamine ammonia-lyase large subunit
MVAKKTIKATVARPFVFRKEWVFDEVPPWVILDRTAQSKIKQLKDQFIKEVNAAIAKGQR